MTDRERWAAYLASLEGPFIKLARLDFLQPDGSLAFSIDNNPKNRRAVAITAVEFIAGLIHNRMKL